MHKELLEKQYESYTDEQLKQKLTPLEYAVTQLSKTEKPFDNRYDTCMDKGIYVDIVSGDPLHTSLTPYEKFCYAMLQFAERCIGK